MRTFKIFLVRVPSLDWKKRRNRYHSWKSGRGLWYRSKSTSKRYCGLRRNFGVIVLGISVLVWPIWRSCLLFSLSREGHIKKKQAVADEDPTPEDCSWCRIHREALELEAKRLRERIQELEQEIGRSEDTRSQLLVSDKLTIQISSPKEFVRKKNPLYFAKVVQDKLLLVDPRMQTDTLKSWMGTYGRNAR